MEELFDYIERYFNNELPVAEREAFEKRCETDIEFAEAVSFYISARQGLKQELNEQRRQNFNELYHELQRKQTPVVSMRKWVAYAAAACILVFAGWFFLLKSPSTKQLADNYIKENLRQRSVTMGTAKDSLQQGIAAFNRKDYNTAENIFLSLTYTRNPEVYENLGIVYLMKGQYDKALSAFQTLSSFKDLHVNNGPFYQAVTYMKRDDTGDKQEAKRLLQEIIEKQLPGNKEAAGWIKHF
ncbi:MAG TPA: tetratricopeptide repeat protein [Chitinophagaceae bacterium]|nr:tetratricopeptide repeat protein [Chitinophagaceae bacterium]